MKKITIAIDGLSSCGKSTMAKMLAKEVGYIYVDTGAMYRAVTLFAMQNGMIAPDGHVDREALKAKMDTLRVEFKLNPETGKAETYLNGENVEREIRGMEANYDEILRNVQERDYKDSHREVSPLRKADDAIELDNGQLTIAQQLQWLVDRFEEKAGKE